MKLTQLLTTTSLVLSASQTLYGAPGDYSPLTAARPSAGYLNDHLRAKDPYLSAWDLGVSVRLRYEFREDGGVIRNADFRKLEAATGENDNSYLLHKIRAKVGYSSEWYNFLVEARDSGSHGDARNPNPEADTFDLHQAYVTVGNHKEFPVSLKLGRQEMSHGDERLLGAFAWNNIGRVFDAAKLRWQNPWFSADLFLGRVIIPNDDYLNEQNHYDWLSGLYATTKRIPKQTTDLYLLARNTTDQSPFTSGATAPAHLMGPSARDIYTLGLRGKSLPAAFGNWDYGYELMFQTGHFNDPALVPTPSSPSLKHEAHALFLQGGYTFAEAWGTPRIGIEYNYASGDSDPLDGKHETFENLYPTNHKFYGFMDFVSLQNIHNIRWSASVKPIARLTLLAEIHSFWLADTSDNFYAVNGARRGGIGATPAGTGYAINSNYDSYVGSELDLVATYQLSPQATVEAGYGHFFVGDYVEQSLRSPAFGSTDADWFYLQFSINL